MIIGITGEARHGKGSVAKSMRLLLSTKGARVQLVSFADPLKDFLTSLVGRSEPFRGTDEERNAPVPEIRWIDLQPYVLGKAQEMGWLPFLVLPEDGPKKHHPTGRQLMMLFGELLRDQFMTATWVRIAICKAENFKGITLIDDVRYENEALRTPNGHMHLLVKVVRPGQSNPSLAAHGSESGPRNIPASWIDATLVNDTDLTSLHMKTKDVLRSWYDNGLLGQQHG